MRVSLINLLAELLLNPARTMLHVATCRITRQRAIAMSEVGMLGGVCLCKHIQMQEAGLSNGCLLVCLVSVHSCILSEFNSGTRLVGVAC